MIISSALSAYIYLLTDCDSTNANAFKISFWLLTYLLHKPPTLVAIRKETQGCILNNEVNIDSLLRCIVLNAAFDDTLRLTSSASSARTVISPTQLRGKILRKNTKLLMPYRQLHFQPAEFGPQVKDFHPGSFSSKTRMMAAARTSSRLPAASHTVLVGS